MKRFVIFLVLGLGGVLFSCQKDIPDVLKPVDDVCSVMDDEGFKEYCLGSFDANGDGILSMEETAQVKTVNVTNRSFTSLKGIEYFSHLEELFCKGNKLASLDVTRNTDLTSLFCASNKLTSLDVSKCSKLLYLDCLLNEITSLDVSNCPELYYLNCGANKLSVLDLSNNPELRQVNCHINKLSSLDVSKNPNLRFLMCTANGISSLDVSMLLDLESLYCDKTDVSPARPFADFTVQPETLLPL